MYYQITEVDTNNYESNSLIFLGNEQAILDFVNERNEGAEEYLTDFEDAKEWLEDNGYEVERRKDLVERLQKGEIIYIQ